MAKKTEETPARHRPLLEIQIHKHQETGSALVIAILATPTISASPLPTPTPAPLSTVQTIKQLVKTSSEHYHTKKMQLPRHDPMNEASREATAWHAQYSLLHYTTCNDPTYIIHRPSHEYRKSFTTWNYC